MRKLIAAAATALMLAGGLGIAHAAPGPNGHNDYGLCNAYQHNSDNAHKAPPFKALQAAADQAGNKDGTASDDEITSYCSGKTPGGK